MSELKLKSKPDDRKALLLAVGVFGLTCSVEEVVAFLSQMTASIIHDLHSDIEEIEITTESFKATVTVVINKEQSND